MPENRSNKFLSLLMNQVRTENTDDVQLGNTDRRCPDFQQSARMESAAPKLKRLRESTRPKLSVRGMAAELGMTPSSYGHYEELRTFKKPFLPMDLVRKLLPVLSSRGIPEAEVLALGGVDTGGGESVSLPPPPPLQLVTMQVALPNEAALARMYEGLLRTMDLSRPVDELARTLARLLPTGLSQLQDLMPAPERGEAPEDDEAPRDRANSDPESQRAPRT